MILKSKIFLSNTNISFPHTEDKLEIHLIRDKWNDFGHQVSYYIYIFYKGKKLKLGNVKISNFNDVDIDNFLTKYNFLPDGSFSLGQSIQYYEVLNSLDKESKNVFLQSMYDIIYDVSLFNKVKNLDVYNAAFVRFIDKNTLENEFIPCVNGVNKTNELGFEYKFSNEENVDNKIVISVDFDKSIINSFAIVGPNGVGKTTFFNRLLKSYYMTSNNGNFSMLKQRMYFSSILHFCFTGFDDEKFNMLNKEIIETERFANCPYYLFCLSEALSNMANGHTFKENLINIIRNDFLRKLFKESVESLNKDPYFDLSPYKSLLNFIESDDSELYELGIAKKENTKDIFNTMMEFYNDMSSGQKYIFLSIFQLISIITRNSLILIDEPENHLHPPLLSLYINILSSIVKKTDSIMN